GWIQSEDAGVSVCIFQPSAGLGKERYNCAFPFSSLVVGLAFRIDRFLRTLFEEFSECRHVETPEAYIDLVIGCGSKTAPYKNYYNKSPHLALRQRRRRVGDG